MTDGELAALAMWRIALHESAHAVAALAMGLPVTFVSARRMDRGIGGLVALQPLPNDMRNPVLTLAGLEADRRAGWPSAGAAASDLGEAVAAAITMVSDNETLPTDPRAAVETVAGALSVFTWRAADLVATHWTRIEAGAAALVDSPTLTLTGAEFAHAVGWGEPAAPTAEGVDDPLYVDLAVCPLCGVRLFLPVALVARLAAAERAAWVAAQLAAVGCPHAADDALGAAVPAAGNGDNSGKVDGAPGPRGGVDDDALGALLGGEPNGAE